MYFSIFLLEKSLESNALHLKELSKNYQNLNALYQNGMAKRSDLNKIHIEISKCEKNALYLSNQKNIALETLILLSHLDDKDQQLSPPDKSQSLSYFEEIFKIFNPDSKQTDFLFDKRPEIAFFSSKQEEVLVRKKLEMSKSLPYVEAFFQSGYANPGLNILQSSFQGYYIAGVRAIWDFSNLYSKSYQDEAIRKENLQIVSQKEEFLFNAKITLLSQLKNVSNLIETLKENEKIIALQQKILQDSQYSMRNGVLSVNDLLTDINKLHALQIESNYQEIELLKSIYTIKQHLNEWELNEF